MEKEVDKEVKEEGGGAQLNPFEKGNSGKSKRWREEKEKEQGGGG